MTYFPNNDTIVAPSTPPGVSALAVIRLSGPGAIGLVNRVFRGSDLEKAASHTAHFGTIKDGDKTLDEVVATLFRAPRSFTREDSVEISCHGSPYITSEIIKLMVRSGARLAEPGEFTRRAFLNGRFDLAQAEAVADLIHSQTAREHHAAIHQMRGGFSATLAGLRAKLLDFASLIELELDFSEEDVEFADRSALEQTVKDLLSILQPLIESFNLGNVLKNGVPTVIAGKPNAGKSTLLNTLLNEDRAIVSEIAGTTRDIIEDHVVIDGVSFRFIDTAGLRESTDTIETIGVEKAREQMRKASVIIYLFDLSTATVEEIDGEVKELKKLKIPLLITGNKLDKADARLMEQLKDREGYLFISAARKDHIEDLKQQLTRALHLGDIQPGDTIITNARHHERLTRTHEALTAVEEGLTRQLTGDLLAEDIRLALHYLGEITGEVTNDEVLGNIFGRFCIGK